MPSRHIQFSAGCFYHLYNRGANRNSIFTNDIDYLDFLERLKKNAVLHGTPLVAYCLMPNHFHLLVHQVGDGSAGHMVQCTCNGYTQAYNLRHEHCGTLFQGRFQSILVDNDDYLRHLCRYIHANPVKDGFAFEPELWPYSDYPGWISRRRGTADVRSYTADFFASGDAYREFVIHWTERKLMPEPLSAYLTGLEKAE